MASNVIPQSLAARVISKARCQLIWERDQHMKQDAPSEQEQEMLDALHEWPEHPHAQLVIELRDGAWKIGMIITIDGEQHSAHGAGQSFNEAWRNMNSTGT